MENVKPYARRKMMINEAIGKVVLKEDLTEGEMEEVMKEITMRSASTTEIASFITALRMKGETPEEITAAARVIKDKSSAINVGDDLVCLDREEITVERETIISTTKGVTGGTTIFNISTATALEGGQIRKKICSSSLWMRGCN
jgi:anthranilate phosphoribosyltransferase